MKIVRLFFSVFLFFLSIVPAFSQYYEVGIHSGISNLVGDIGRSRFIDLVPGNLSSVSISEIPFYGGVFYKRNINPRHSIRVNIGYNYLVFNDKYADEEYRRNRKLIGTNNLYEITAMFEYNFFPINNSRLFRPLVSPYIFVGFSGLLMDNLVGIHFRHELHADRHGISEFPNVKKDLLTYQDFIYEKKVIFGVPFGIGIKKKYESNWTIFAEVIFRPTFSDGIDYSIAIPVDTHTRSYGARLSSMGDLLKLYYDEIRSRENNSVGGKSIGNIESKDWVNTISVGISYAFGRNSCYCNR